VAEVASPSRSVVLGLETSDGCAACSLVIGTDTLGSRDSRWRGKLHLANFTHDAQGLSMWCQLAGFPRFDAFTGHTHLRLSIPATRE
jgi:hypothetical protein